MKGKRSILLSLFMITLLTFLSILQSGFAKEGGAPSGNTGSPGDGQSCAHTDCHTGTALPKDGLISTDVPASGYVSGEDYTITVSVTDTGTVKFGFQASPQTLDGDLVGDMDLINTSQTKFVGGGKYVTHTSTGSNGADVKTWTFSWTPEDATGDVTFYVAVNVANNDDHATGDRIYTSSVTVTEDSTNIPLVIDEPEILFEMTNPVSNLLELNIVTEYNSALTIEVIDINGRPVQTEHFGYSSGHYVLDLSGVPPGMYFTRVIQDENNLVKQFIKL